MSNFSMGTISGMGFAQALVHTVHSTCAFGTRAMNCTHLCLCKTHSRDCPHAEIRHRNDQYYCFATLQYVNSELKKIICAW